MDTNKITEDILALVDSSPLSEVNISEIISSHTDGLELNQQQTARREIEAVLIGLRKAGEIEYTDYQPGITSMSQQVFSSSSYKIKGSYKRREKLKTQLPIYNSTNMDNELAYEILRLIKEGDLHSHSQVHPRIIANAKHINVTASETKAIWEMLHRNYCLIHSTADIGYSSINPETNCIDIYREKAGKDKLQSEKEKTLQSLQIENLEYSIDKLKKELPNYDKVETRAQNASTKSTISICLSILIPLILLLLKWKCNLPS